MTRAAHHRVVLRVQGRVQGVGFRYATLDQARILGLTGWVRNTDSGAVEVVAEGEEERLQRLITWCHAGPRGALVTDVDQHWLAASGEFDGFHIAR